MSLTSDATAATIKFVIGLGLANYTAFATMPETMMQKLQAPTGSYNTYIFGLLATSGLTYYIFLGSLVFGLTEDWTVAGSLSLAPWILLKASNLVTKKATKVGYPMKSDIYPLTYALATTAACCLARSSPITERLSTGFAYLLVLSGTSATIAPSNLCKAWGGSLEEMLKAEPVILTSLRSHGLGMVRTGSAVLAVGNYGMPVAQAFGYTSFLTLAMMAVPKLELSEKKKLSNGILVFGALHLMVIVATLYV
ncbi:expressed unknown protein [Seminavis robusta]|uniref:Uncharacterized protein n=1 Tax=Seminavis robusta TaxID=568900 RepID=A0A9N8DGM5_9STRA|nr:expressed unknown protein [Seminavis robusta]|eukprot:Sro82_g043940.1 n/a (252) ;mRNA; r:83061-83816